VTAKPKHEQVRFGNDLTNNWPLSNNYQQSTYSMSATNQEEEEEEARTYHTMVTASAAKANAEAAAAAAAAETAAAAAVAAEVANAAAIAAQVAYDKAAAATAAVAADAFADTEEEARRQDEFFGVGHSYGNNSGSYGTDEDSNENIDQELEPGVTPIATMSLWSKGQ
jgi:membrane protein involved in colicin uptake